MADPSDEFVAVMKQAADIFERTWQPAPYPSAADHPAVLAHEAASNIGLLIGLHAKGTLGTELKGHEASTLMDAEDILRDLADRIAGDNLPELLPPWR